MPNFPAPSHSEGLQLADFPVRVVGLQDLILSKRTLARPKDLRVARALELVLARLKSP